MPNMDLTRDEAETELHDALDEAVLTSGLRDRIDNALAELIRAERADVLDHLVIGIEHPDHADLEAIVRRPLN